MRKKISYVTPDLAVFSCETQRLVCLSQYGAGEIPGVSVEEETSEWEELL